MRTGRRQAVRRLGRLAAALLLMGALGVAGCGRGPARAGIADAVDNTTRTLRDLLLGLPPEALGTSPARPDPPLLTPGSYQAVLLTADADGFARASKNEIRAEAIQDLQGRVVRNLDRDLKKRGFTASGAPWETAASAARGAPKILLATLVPITEESGSPAERAAGRGRTILLIRLTVSDPATNKTLVQRDYYSGRDIGGRRDNRR